MEFIKQIEESIPTLQMRKNQLQTEENVGFLTWIKEQFTGNVRYSSIEDIQKIEFYLTQALHKLYFIHKVHSFINNVCVKKTFRKN